MKLFWVWIILVACVVILLYCKQKFSINLNETHDWEYYWNEANRIKNTPKQPIRFFLENLHIQDKFIHSKIKFEDIVNQTASWAKNKYSIILPPLKIKWRDGPTME